MAKGKPEADGLHGERFLVDTHHLVGHGLDAKILATACSGDDPSTAGA